MIKAYTRCRCRCRSASEDTENIFTELVRLVNNLFVRVFFFFFFCGEFVGIKEVVLRNQ